MPAVLSNQQLALLARSGLFGGGFSQQNPIDFNLGQQSPIFGNDKSSNSLFGAGSLGGSLFGGTEPDRTLPAPPTAPEGQVDSTFGERFLSQDNLFGALQSGLFGAEQFNKQKASRASAIERQTRLEEANIGLAEARVTDLLRGPAPRALKNPITLIDPKDPDSRISVRPGSQKVDELLELGFVIAPGRLEQDTAGAFSGQRGKLQIEINEQVAAINTFGSRANRLLPLIAEGGNTLVASLSNVGNRVFQEVKALSRSFGIDFESGDDAFNVSRYDGAFSAAGLAGASPRAKAGFLGLAIQKAIASGLGTGKALSDKDIENQLISIGKNQADPDIVRQLFIDDFNNLSDGVRFRAQASGLKLPELVSPEFLDTPLGTTLDSDGGLVIDLTQ